MLYQHWYKISRTITFYLTMTCMNSGTIVRHSRVEQDSLPNRIAIMYICSGASNKTDFFAQTQKVSLARIELADPENHSRCLVTRPQRGLKLVKMRLRWLIKYKLSYFKSTDDSTCQSRYHKISLSSKRHYSKLPIYT